MAEQQAIPEVTARGTHSRGALSAAADFVRKSPLSAFWGFVGLLLVIMAVSAPLIAPADPLFADFYKVVFPPDRENWFGTDKIGRDYLSRTIYGARTSLYVAVMAVGIGTSLGAVIGLTGGFFGGKVDLYLERLNEVILALPGLIFAMVLVVSVGANVTSVILAIAVTRVPVAARVIRSVVLGVKEMPYVEAARAIGASPLRTIVQHVAPQCVAVFLIISTMHLGSAIIIEASLGFLGAGVPPPTPTWGSMLGDAASAGDLDPEWWLVFFPGLFITLAVLAFNLFGDGIRDALDPRLRGTT